MCKVTRERKSAGSNMQKSDTIAPSTASIVILLHKHGPFADLREDIGTVKSVSNYLINGEYPFISILVATYNESLVLKGS